MRLVADNGIDVENIARLPVHNPQIIPDIARTFADRVEEGKFGQVERVIVIVETDEGLAKLYWGDGITHIEAVGILQMALFSASGEAIDSYADEAD